MQNHQAQAAKPIRSAFTRPIISQKIRSFDTLAEAGRHIERLQRINRPYRFNIIQAGRRWCVCRIVSGEV
ncbi:hypothetical protein LVJ83_11880 [Uruburuella testudinis]|uniref:Uncharacterized protein n=1 Tax=Uruburuella testudinis TaxID=1282863 RepID=A0ABY4DSM0_9NEIS|nr:hypothetical protein [Uruburuella testudinis]UOO81607.1 hypothetical protein LVJ83_11880 [Uruburuella testudinis]